MNAITHITMPLKSNVPQPNHKDWILKSCPKCGRECWESELARNVKEVFTGAIACCTECALKGK